MWLRLSNGRNELVVNEDHIRRLLSEGAVEIPDPRSKPEETPLPVEPVQESEQSSPDTDPDEEATQHLPVQKKTSRRATKPAKE
jgi:hypothetical protein